MAANFSLDEGSKVIQRVVNGVVNESFTTSDEEISSKAKIPASCSHAVISTNVVGSKHEAKRQDRKFTWDFYE